MRYILCHQENNEWFETHTSVYPISVPFDEEEQEHGWWATLETGVQGLVCARKLYPNVKFILNDISDMEITWDEEKRLLR